MTPTGMDDRLKRLFQDLRQQDEKAAPPFHRLAQQATRSPAEPRARPWLTLAAAAALLVLGVSVAVFRAATPRAPDPAAGWTALSGWQPTLDPAWSGTSLAGWQSSTDGLLTLSSTAWSGRGATLSDSWLFIGTGHSETSDANPREAL